MAQDDLQRRLRALRIIPVITIDDPSRAADLGRALIEGGLPVAEITFRSDSAADSIAALRTNCPQMLIGAGTVLDLPTLDQALDAGASFIVAPGYNPTVVERCLQLQIPIIPGINTPSEIEIARSRGLRLLKFFPAEQSGGLSFLSAVAAPYRDVSFMPTGGINRGNLAQYLAQPYVAACGGSWIATAADIADQNFPEITARAREAVALASPIASH